MNAPANIQHNRNNLDCLLRWRPQIERALRDANLLTFEDIVKGVLSRQYLYFDNMASFAVVEVQDYTKGRVCHVLVAGGSLRGLRDLQEAATPFFKSIGARRLTQVGRQGFTRRLPAFGWKQPRILMELEF